ncbi:MAG: hypothetical protein C4306_10145, partial [Thermoleophilia bacterium]
MRPVRLFASLLTATVVLVAPASGSAPRTPPPPAEAELRALGHLPERAPIATQRIYFVVTDRYANGDTANDRGGLRGSRGLTGFDPTDPAWFHGGDLRGLTGGCTDHRKGLVRVKDLGFTSVWITPPFRQRFVQGSSAAYHGYWPLDLMTVDPHLGTERDFGTFVACAHRLGLKIYLDVV